MNELTRGQLDELKELVTKTVKNTTMFLVFLDKGKLRSADMAFQSVQDLVLNTKVGESNGYFVIPTPTLRQHRIAIDWAYHLWSRVTETYNGCSPADLLENFLNQKESLEGEEEIKECDRAINTLTTYPFTS